MKQLISALALTISTHMMAQVPAGMSYQAVVRNAFNALVQDASIGIRVSILQGGSDGAVVYQEVQTVMTNVNGLLTMEIGQGTPILGSFTNVPWANGPCFLQTEIDPSGGTSYSITSTTQMLSVPYAFYAKTSSDAARIKTLIYTGF